MNKAREGNFDLLRIIAAIAIITIHVSATYVSAITNKEIFGELYLNGAMTSCIYNVLSRFAVPCFVMLSGAFILADEKNAEYRYFYRKTFKNIGIPTLIFSILYFLYSLFSIVIKTKLKWENLNQLLNPIKDFIKGAPFYHMWYLYMMIGVYLLVPVILLFKQHVGEKIFNRATWIFVVVASLCAWTSESKFFWDIGSSFRYIGYFMLGYELRRIFSKNKNNKKACGLIIGGVLIEIGVSILRYNQAINGIAEDKANYNLIDPFCPLIVIASILIFAGFSCMEIKKDLSKLSALTFLIYLFHAGYWDLFSKIIFKIGCEWDNRIVIPVSIIILFTISAISAKLYLKIWKRIETKIAVSDKLCSLIKLR